MLGVVSLFVAAQGMMGVGQVPPLQCTAPYSNGDTFDRVATFMPNSPELTIDNKTGSDAIVRLQDLASPASATIFVSSGSQAKLTSVPPGTYEVRLAYNGIIARDCVTLQSADSIVVMPEVQTFLVEETRTSEGVERRWSSNVLTLYERVVRGRRAANAGEKISVTQFNSQ